MLEKFEHVLVTLKEVRKSGRFYPLAQRRCTECLILDVYQHDNQLCYKLITINPRRRLIVPAKALHIDQRLRTLGPDLRRWPSRVLSGYLSDELAGLNRVNLSEKLRTKEKVLLRRQNQGARRSQWYNNLKQYQRFLMGLREGDIDRQRVLMERSRFLCATRPLNRSKRKKLRKA